MAPDVLSKVMLRTLVSTYLCDYFWPICWEQVVYIDNEVKESMFIAAKDIDNGGHFMFPVKAGKFKKTFPEPWDLYRVVFKAVFSDGIMRQCDAQVLWEWGEKSTKKVVFHDHCDPPVNSVHSYDTRHTVRSDNDMNILKLFVDQQGRVLKDGFFRRVFSES